MDHIFDLHLGGQTLGLCAAISTSFKTACLARRSNVCRASTAALWAPLLLPVAACAAKQQSCVNKAYCVNDEDKLGLGRDQANGGVAPRSSLCVGALNRSQKKLRAQYALSSQPVRVSQHIATVHVMASRSSEQPNTVQPATKRAVAASRACACGGHRGPKGVARRTRRRCRHGWRSRRPLRPLKPR